jgi:hypothetical protein
MPRSPLPPPARLEVNPPRVFTGRAVLACCAYGFWLLLPVLLVSMVLASLLGFGWATFGGILLATAAASYFLPFGFGNPYVTRLVRALPYAGGPAAPRFVVQLTLCPRLRSGVRALLEDADDIGWLSLSDTHLVFQGDSVRLSLPFEQIRRLEQPRHGWRRFFLCDPRLELSVSGLAQVEGLQLAERSSWVLPSSRRTTRALRQLVAAKIASPPGC